jgi:hypothetical protein
VPDFSGTTFSVSSTTTSVSTISLSSDAMGNLRWNDTRYAGGQIRPGTYTITASLPGYISDPVTFTCPVLATCAPTGLVLRQLGSLKVTTVDGAQPVNGAIVTLFKAGQIVEARTEPNDSNTATFTGLRPGATDYTLRIQAPGYAFDSGTLTCTRPGTPGTESSIAVSPGAETACTAELSRLARITGTVQGVLGGATATEPVQNLAGARITATECTAPVPATGPPQYCTATGPTRFVGTTDANGQFTLTGTAQTPGINDGVWLLRAELAGWRTVPTPPAEALDGVAVRVTGGADVTQNVRLHVVPVDYTVVAEDQYGARVDGLTVRLLRGTTPIDTAVPVSGQTGTYLFDDAIPGTYVLEIAGTGIVRSTTQVRIEVGILSQTYLVPVGRAVNSISGTVVGSDAPNGLDDVDVTLHSCSAGGGACSSTVATGTDGQPLATTSDAAGTFLFRTVPDGTFEVRFVKRKYADLTGGPFTVNQTVGALPPLRATMIKVTRSATVAIATVPAGGNLAGTTVTLVSTDGSEPDQVFTLLAGGSATFSQVPYGCWNVELTLPAGHFGNVNVLGSGDHPDGTCSGDIVVANTASGSRLTANVEVVETQITVQVTADPVDGHTAPATARVTIDGVDLAQDVVNVGSGGVVVHLAPGIYDITATPTGLAPAVAQFWPPDSEDNVMIARGAAARVVPLVLVEALGELTVSTVLQGTNTAVAGTITLAPGSGQGASVPAAYQSGVPTTGEVTLDLPSGPWSVTATTADGRTSTANVNLTDLDDEVEIELPPPTNPNSDP